MSTPEAGQLRDAALYAEAAVAVRLCASMDGVAARLDQEAEYRRRLESAVVNVPFAAPVPIVGGAQVGAFFSQFLGPPARCYWSVRALVAQGFTAGSVSVFFDDPNGEICAVFPQAGLYTFGRAERLVRPGSQLVVTAAGITGQVQLYGAVDMFPDWYMSSYIT